MDILDIIINIQTKVRGGHIKNDPSDIDVHIKLESCDTSMT